MNLKLPKFEFKAYQQLEEKFDELSDREKWLALMSGLVAVLFGGYVWLVEPVQIEIKKLNSNVTRQKSELGRLDKQIAAVERELDEDPNDPLLKSRSRLTEELVLLDEKLREQTVDLIPAKRMPAVLEKILGQSSELKVLEMSSIAPVRMMDINADSGAQVNLFQHGILLVLEGEYKEIWKYLNEIENLEWRFYWKRFDYVVGEHPIAKAEIELYTLSTSQAFIGV
ncbi:MAG: MSHA biogenesis protein MshJ [Alteromonadaceae bacterium]|nr:MSHA biogenesis protein MshJ [Alteromonadaceae bacterium]